MAPSQSPPWSTPEMTYACLSIQCDLLCSFCQKILKFHDQSLLTQYIDIQFVQESLMLICQSLNSFEDSNCTLCFLDLRRQVTWPHCPFKLSETFIIFQTCIEAVLIALPVAVIGVHGCMCTICSSNLHDTGFKGTGQQSEALYHSPF